VEAIPVKDLSCSQPAISKWKGIVCSDRVHKPLSMRSHLHIHLSSWSSVIHAIKQLASAKQGKKCAQGEVDAEFNGEHMNQCHCAGMSDADSAKGLLHRCSGLKKAVMNIAETAFIP
jgi:hypothetical protein